MMTSPSTLKGAWAERIKSFRWRAGIVLRGGSGSGNFGYVSKVEPDVPSGGSNSPMSPDEKLLAQAVSRQMKAQLAEVHGRVETGRKADAVPDKLRLWDKAMVDEVRPVWYRVFRKGGDAGLRRVVRRGKKGWEPVEVLTKARSDRTAIVIPEWVDDPHVLAAIERELFKFAHTINQTTADALRETLFDAMAEGLPIREMADQIADLSDEWVEGWRAEMIARTESARAYSRGAVEAWRTTGVVSRKVWHAAGDACPFCLEMEGKAVGLDETFFDEGDEQEADWQGHDMTMEHDYGDVDGPPLHPNCLLHGSSQVYTSKGWKRIVDIRVGELALTHKGRFRKVTKVHCNPFDGYAVKIKFGHAGRYLTVTEDHPVLVGGKWIAAKEVREGAVLSVLGHPCARCGKVTMWNMRYCSRRCLSLDITDRQWADPKHRELVAKKNAIAMNRQYRTGERDRFEITRIAANHAGKYPFVPVRVLGVSRWKVGKPRAVYNLSVAEDESYIAKGMVVHNCRCVLLAEISEKGLAMLDVIEKGNTEQKDEA